MIELTQFPWSPYCIVARRILEYSGARFKIRNISSVDRSEVWKLTRQRYYQVPVVKFGSEVVFEIGADSQVVAKFLDAELQLGLFPREHEGVQRILWPHIENQIEDMTFRLNDVYWKENVPARDQLEFLRFKERKFGRGCLEDWRKNQKRHLNQLAERLEPFELMLATHEFLLDARPRFVDFDLCGMLGNFLYSGHYQLPARHSRLKKWYERMAKIKFDEVKKN